MIFSRTLENIVLIANKTNYEPHLLMNKHSVLLESRNLQFQL
jgi:hypothetical protein